MKQDELVYIAVLVEIQREFPDHRLVRKQDSWFMRFLAFLLFFNRKFMAQYTTTIGRTTWTPREWDTWPPYARAIIMRHERIHMRQRRKHGAFLYAFLYLFWPLPFVLAVSRTRFEQEAYTETMRAYRDYYGMAYVRNPAVRERVVRHFTTAEYGWMWPARKDVEEWYTHTANRLAREPYYVAGRRDKMQGLSIV